MGAPTRRYETCVHLAPQSLMICLFPPDQLNQIFATFYTTKDTVPGLVCRSLGRLLRCTGAEYGPKTGPAVGQNFASFCRSHKWARAPTYAAAADLEQVAPMLQHRQRPLNRGRIGSNVSPRTDKAGGRRQTASSVPAPKAAQFGGAVRGFGHGRSLLRGGGCGGFLFHGNFGRRPVLLQAP